MTAEQFKTYSPGQYVNIKCPAYRRGKKLEAIIKEDKGHQVTVIVKGNSKSTKLHKAWIM